MPRYRVEQDKFLAVDLDTAFTGVDARRDPGVIRTHHQFYDANKELQPIGLASKATNLRFSSGAGETRLGVMAPVSFNHADILANNLAGVGRFSDPDGEEWLLVAVVGKANIYAVRDNEGAELIPIPEAPAAGDDWHIFQTFDGAQIHRGLTKNPWAWNGNFGASFSVPTVGGSDPSFIDPLPPVSYGITAANRVWAVSTRDQIVVSDLLDYTSYDSDYNTLRINEGSDDEIISLAPWRESNIVVFKEQSIALITSAVGDLSNLAVEMLNHEIGIAGKHAWATIGGDIVFLSGRGQLFRLTEALENVKMVQEQALSEPLEPLFEEIDGANLSKACVAVHGRYVYVAAPTRDSTNNENNRTFVWDSITRQWQGYDYVSSEQGGVFDPRRFIQTDYLGKKELVGIHFKGGTGGMIAVMEQNLGEDQTRDSGGETLTDIASLLQTRGYTHGEFGLKRVRRVNVALDQWCGTVTVKSITEGVEEKLTLINARTFSRTAYLVHATPDYVETNANDDFHNPKREDYSLVLDQTNGTELGTDGLTLNLHQSYLLPVRPMVKDRWTAFEISSSTGSIKVKAVQAEAITAGPRERVYA